MIYQAVEYSVTHWTAEIPAGYSYSIVLAVHHRHGPVRVDKTGGLGQDDPAVVEEIGSIQVTPQMP